MVCQKRVLVVSNDLMALQTRKLMLGAYFDVLPAGRINEAQIVLAKQKVDLIVLCYTLTEDDCQKIADAAREHSSRAKIIKLTVPGNTSSAGMIFPYLIPADKGPFYLVKKSAELLGFEFRSKGRMVAVAPANVLAASPRV